MYFGKGCEYFAGKWEEEERLTEEDKNRISPELVFCKHEGNQDDCESNCNNKNCPRREEFNKVIQDLSNEWHNTETILSLKEYVGMTTAEYIRWVNTKEIPNTVFSLDKFQEKIKNPGEGE